jgi:PAS domain S-box-containing protein
MILVIDDDSESLAVLTEILTAADFMVTTAATSHRALAAISAFPPKIILISLGLPLISEAEICKHLKACDATRHIPVILLRSAGHEENTGALRLGADDFISRPFHAGEVVARVRIQLEMARLRSEAREGKRGEEGLQDLADCAPAALWVLGADMRLLVQNQQVSAFTGGHELCVDDRWTRIVHPDDLAAVLAKHRAAVASGQPFQIECRIRHHSGEYRWVLHTGAPRYIAGAFAGHTGTSVDITDLKRIQNRSLSAEKLRSIGCLTAGIAHDFNNLVGGIFAASDMALSDLPPDSPARDNVERISALAARASQVVNLLLAYGGGIGSRTDRIDLSLVVAEMLVLLKGTISPDAELEANLAPGLPVVVANITEIRQVVLNLIMNASESLQRRKGKIRVTTERARASSGKPFCRLVVSDTGSGMPPDVCARAFDPFYSTKCVGRGLGLAVVDGIIRSMGGTITVNSKPGCGSTFEVMLPCAEARSAPARFGGPDAIVPGYSFFEATH